MTVPPGRRLAPDKRREDLLAHGVRLLSTHPVADVTIELLAAEAGVSKGLMYHYFGSKRDFHLEVVRRAAEIVYTMSAPPDEGTSEERLRAAIDGYVRCVVDHPTSYASLLRAAAGGDDELAAVYEDTRDQVVDRAFATGTLSGYVIDSPASRMVVRAWLSFAEDLVLNWHLDPRGLSREDVIRICADSLPTLTSRFVGAGSA